MNNQQPFDPYDFSKKEIDTVPVYWKNLPWAPCVHIRIGFRVGGYNDPVGKEGLAHFLEHISFDGNPSMQTKKDVREWGKQYTLDTLNAWTSNVNTVFTCKCLPQYYAEVIHGLSDMMFASFMREEDVSHEHKVIGQEALQRFKNEKLENFIKRSQAALYSGTQAERIFSPLGWPETIPHISRDDLANYHAAHYGKENMFIIIAGNITEDMLDTLADLIHRAPNVTPARVDFGIIGAPREKMIRVGSDEIGDPRDQAAISIGRIAPPTPIEQEELISLTSRFGYDRLFEKLRDEQSLCYSVQYGGSTSLHYFSGGLSVSTKEEHVDTIIAEFWNIIDEIKNGQWRDKFEQLKKNRLDEIASRELLTKDVVQGTVRDITSYSGRILTTPEQIAQVTAATYEDVAQLTDWMFPKDLTLTEIILPTKS